MYSQSKKIFKLQSAINSRGHKLLFSNTQFYSDDKKRPITIYHIKDSIKNAETGKYENKELFASPSQLQIIFFLRDYWYILNDMDLPTDNKIWNKIREERLQKILPLQATEVKN